LKLVCIIYKPIVRDLQIVNFCSNRITNRIGATIWIWIESRIESGCRTSCQCYSQGLMAWGQGQGLKCVCKLDNSW